MQIKSYRCVTKPALDELAISRRYQFAINYRTKPVEWWRKICFSDESYFHVGDYCYHHSVWRQKEEKYKPTNVKNKINHPKSFMVWGWINYDGVGKLVKIDGTIDSGEYIKILTKNLPFEKNFIFVHDGASVHRADAVAKWMGKNSIAGLKDFPAYSPDLNVIEHVWGIMKNQLEMNPARDLEDLWIKIVDIWNSLSLSFIRNLIDSIPCRLEAIKKAKGGHTSY